MALTANEIRVIVRSEVQQAQAGMRQVQGSIGRLEKQGQALQKQFAAVGAAFLGAFAATRVIRGIQRFTQESIAAAAALEEIEGKFRAVFRESADEAERWAADYASSVGRSRTETLEYLSTVQDTLVPMGMFRDEAARMSTEIVSLATDIASFNNQPTAQVIQAIQSAMVGQNRSMLQYGVVLNQAKVEQEAINMGLIRQGGQLDELSRAQAAFNLIMAGTADAQGDAERTADRLANTQRRLEASMRDLREEIGREFAPTVRGATSFLASFVQGMADARREAREFQEVLDLAARGGDQDAAVEQRVRNQEMIIRQLERQIEHAESLSLRQRRMEGIDERRIGNMREQLAGARALLTELQGQLELQKAQHELDQQAAREREQIAQREAEELERRNRVRDARIDAETEYREQQRITQTLAEVGFLNQEEALRRNIRAAERLVETLAEVGYTGTRGDVGDTTMVQTIAELQMMEAQLEELGRTAADVPVQIGTTLAQDLQIYEEQWRDFVAQMNREWALLHVDERQEVERARDHFIAAGIDRVEAERWAAAEIRRINQETTAEVIATVQHAVTPMTSAWSGYISEVNRQEAARNRAVIRNLQAETREAERSFRDQLVLKQQMGEDTVQFEEDQRTKMLELEHERAVKEHEIAQKEFERDKKARRSQALQSGAQAVVQTFARWGFPWGLVPAAVMGGITAKQVAMIQSQSFPGFARGADFVTRGRQLIMVGDNPGGREHVRIDPQPDNRRAGSPVVVVKNYGTIVGAGGERELARRIAVEIRKNERQGITS